MYVSGMYFSMKCIAVFIRQLSFIIYLYIKKIQITEINMTIYYMFSSFDSPAIDYVCIRVRH